MIFKVSIIKLWIIKALSIIRYEITIIIGSERMNSYESKLKSEEMDLLFNAILTLKDTEECYKFFEDVATINEIKALAQRIHVAKLLSEKKTYTEIAEVTGASTATISRVNRCVNYGSNGYNIVLERIKEGKSWYKV